MKKIHEASLLELLPESVLLDPKLRASAEALDAQFQAVTAATREVLHLPRLNELHGNIIDYIAEQLHIDFYEPLYLTEAEKKELIRTSIAWHRIKGTPAAVEQIAHAAFRDAEIIEWFEYPEGNGEPYHFKIRSHGYKETPDGWATYLRLINVAKNVRSWCDNLEVYWDETDIGKNQAYAAALELQTGAKDFSLNKPPDVLPTKVFVGNANWISGDKTESLKIPKLKFATQDFFGQVLTKIGSVKIGSETKSDADNYFARTWKAKIFAGMSNFVHGKKIWNISLPRKQTTQTFTGTANLIFGDKVESLQRPRLNFDEKFHAAQVLTKVGTVKIDSATKSDADNYFARTWKTKSFAGNANWRTGELTIKKTPPQINRKFVVRVGVAHIRTGYITIGCVKEDDDWDFPDEGDWLRLWFRFPNYRPKQITLSNPRDDVAGSDVSEVGNYAADNGLLVNRLGQETTGISKAALIIKRERKIL